MEFAIAGAVWECGGLEIVQVCVILLSVSLVGNFTQAVRVQFLLQKWSKYCPYIYSKIKGMDLMFHKIPEMVPLFHKIIEMEKFTEMVPAS